MIVPGMQPWRMAAALWVVFLFPTLLLQDHRLRHPLQFEQVEVPGGADG